MKALFVALNADDFPVAVHDDGTDKDGIETEILPPQWDMSVQTLSQVVGMWYHMRIEWLNDISYR